MEFLLPLYRKTCGENIYNRLTFYYIFVNIQLLFVIMTNKFHYELDSFIKTMLL